MLNSSSYLFWPISASISPSIAQVFLSIDFEQLGSIPRMVFNDSPGHTSQWRHVPCDITMNGSGRTEGNDAVVAKLKGLGKKATFFWYYTFLSKFEVHIQ